MLFLGFEKDFEDGPKTCSECAIDPGISARYCSLHKDVGCLSGSKDISGVSTEIYPSFYFCVCLSVYICQSVYQKDIDGDLSIILLLCLSVCLYLSICLSIFSIYLSICTCVCKCVYISICIACINND